MEMKLSRKNMFAASFAIGVVGSAAIAGIVALITDHLTTGILLFVGLVLLDALFVGLSKRVARRP